MLTTTPSGERCGSAAWVSRIGASKLVSSVASSSPQSPLAHRPAVVGAGVVDQEIEPAELVFDLLRQREEHFPIGNVERKGERFVVSQLHGRAFPVWKRCGRSARLSTPV